MIIMNNLKCAWYVGCFQRAGVRRAAKVGLLQPQADQAEHLQGAH